MVVLQHLDMLWIGKLVIFHLNKLWIFWHLLLLDYFVYLDYSFYPHTPVGSNHSNKEFFSLIIPNSLLYVLDWYLIKDPCLAYANYSKYSLVYLEYFFFAKELVCWQFANITILLIIKRVILNCESVFVYEWNIHLLL